MGVAGLVRKATKAVFLVYSVFQSVEVSRVTDLLMEPDELERCHLVAKGHHEV
jgi:hypothetical protein